MGPGGSSFISHQRRSYYSAVSWDLCCAARHCALIAVLPGVVCPTWGCKAGVTWSTGRSWSNCCILDLGLICTVSTGWDITAFPEFVGAHRTLTANHRMAWGSFGAHVDTPVLIGAPRTPVALRDRDHRKTPDSASTFTSYDDIGIVVPHACMLGTQLSGLTLPHTQRAPSSRAVRASTSTASVVPPPLCRGVYTARCPVPCATVVLRLFL